eukprot:4015367-Alexandrium_andersonii.AAC.1
MAGSERTGWKPAMALSKSQRPLLVLLLRRRLRRSLALGAGVTSCGRAGASTGAGGADGRAWQGGGLHA